MKFIFKNLGPINEAEMELGDLTILAGRNNTGKTYAAYMLYGFLRTWLDLSRVPEIQPWIPNGVKFARTVMEEGQAKWPVDREKVPRMRRAIIRAIARNFSKKSLLRVFSAPPNDFEGSSLAIVPDGMAFKWASVSIEHPSTGDVFTLTYGDDEVCIRRSKEGRRSRLTSPLRIRRLLSELYLLFLFPELPDPFILSAERFSISLFYRELDFARSRRREFIRGQMEDREEEDFHARLASNERVGRYTLPIRDNIDYTRDIPNLQKQQSKIYDFQLFNDIRDMMGGYYRSSSDDIRFISRARRVRRFNIPLHAASSSVRGLSDLYFFLRHVAEEGQLLIIDEPESHLDTVNQIQFARLLARAVNAGLKVMITTHSDYIVKEINNLLMLSKSFKDKSKVLKKYKYSEHDFLKPDSVRAYVAENNSLTRCPVDRYGIEMPVFDTTIDAINRVSSELEARLTYEGGE